MLEDKTCNLWETRMLQMKMTLFVIPSLKFMFIDHNEQSAS